MSRPHFAALLLGGVLGALAACNATRPPTAPPEQCTDVACKPPTCCGQDCAADGGCCTGTVCSLLNKCVPSSCAACGAAGCTYDPASCTGTCTTPACCLATCTSQADCCAGTKCSLASSGTMKCFPTGCDGCVGMRPYCKTDAQCGVSCEKPPTCGNACSAPAECGPGSTCKSFTGGSLCVPAVFDTECARCPMGCLLDKATCSVLCVGIDAGVEDAGAPDDAGPQGTCLTCCSACVPDAGLGCCAGSTCTVGTDGVGHCTPEACLACPYGCDYACPGTTRP